MKKIGHILTLMMILSGCNDASVQYQVYEHGNQLVADYVAEFNSTDEEIYVQMYDNSDAEQFLKDTRTYGDWINQNEPELRQYIDKPYGRYLLKGWLDKVAKNPANADKWEAMNPYQKYQMLEKHYRELEKFGEDYAAGRIGKDGKPVQTQTAQTQQQQQAPSQQQNQNPPVNAPVPNSGRDTNTMPPSNNFALMLQDAMNKRGVSSF